MYYDKRLSAIHQYLRKISGREKDTEGDHNYVKHWSAHAECLRTKPAKMLFMNPVLQPQSVHTNSDEEIDVVDVTESTSSPFDNQRTKVLANELERSLKCTLNISNDESELEDFQPENYYPYQRKMFNQCMELINNLTLARMAYVGQPHEFVKRKLVTERCARKLRIIYANTFYDFHGSIFWFHKLILDKGNVSTISSYLSMLQALKSKIPDIVNRILRSYRGRLSYDYVCQILKKSWDPTVPVLNQQKLKKLPNNPLLIMIYAGLRHIKTPNESPRFRFLMNHLNALCKTIQIPMIYDGSCSLEKVLDDLIFALTRRITEFKKHFPNRPVILAGWTVGALLACYVALETPVDAVVCFGFPLTGVNGSRGDLDDPLLLNTAPILFIVGQNSNMCSTDDIEDFRSRMKAESGLVIVGGADDLLNVSPTKLLHDGITQEIVDKCILDEISDFLQALLVNMPGPSNLLSNNPITSCSTIIEENSDTDEIIPKQEGKRKRQRPKEWSPEPPLHQKRAKNSSKEASNISIKSQLSSPSSEASSSGYRKNNKPSTTKAGRKNCVKRPVGRPPGKTGRKKTFAKPAARSSTKPATKPFTKPSMKPLPKPVIKPAVIPTIKPSKDPAKFPSSEPGSQFPKQEIFKAFKPVSPAPVVSVVPKKMIPVKLTKSSRSFALNILPKKNDLVDVEKAFGKDNSFLHQPLTLPEPEDTNSADETEKVTAELEANSQPVSAPSKPSLNFKYAIPQIISSSGRSFMPVSELPSVAILGSKASPGSIIKPVLNSGIDPKKGVSVYLNPSNYKTVFQHGRLTVPNIGSGPIHLKNITGVDLSCSQPKSSNPSEPVYSFNSKTILFPKQTPPAKIFKILPKGSLAIKRKILPMTKVIGSNNSMDTSEKTVTKSPLLQECFAVNQNDQLITKTVGSNNCSESSVKLVLQQESFAVKRKEMPVSKFVKTVSSSEPPEKPVSQSTLLTKDHVQRSFEKDSSKCLDISSPSAKHVTVNDLALSEENTSKKPDTGSQSATLMTLIDLPSPAENSVKKPNARPQTATLVKFMPHKSQKGRHFHVLKTLPSYSTIPRVDIQEEKTDKHLVVQALNRKEHNETPIQMHLKDPGYSICYAKPDGSVKPSQFNSK